MDPMLETGRQNEGNGEQFTGNHSWEAFLDRLLFLLWRDFVLCFS
jgi:hypothetical protein